MRPLDEALDCAYRKWAVVPLHWPEAPGRCSCRRSDCGSIGKHPLTRNGLKDASCDFAQVERWWRQWPQANVAACTGKASGIMVLDIDGPAGKTSLAELVARNTPLPTTWTVTTGRGLHYYFRWVDGSRNRANVAPGVDVRSCGGYVVGAGSVHDSGAVYESTVRVMPVDAPEWLRALIVGTPRAPRELTRRQWDESRPLPPLAACMMRPATEGQRNWNLYRFACWLVDRTDSNHLGQLLREANQIRCSPPLPDSEVEGVRRSAERHRQHHLNGSSTRARER